MSHILSICFFCEVFLRTNERELNGFIAHSQYVAASSRLSIPTPPKNTVMNEPETVLIGQGETVDVCMPDNWIIWFF